MIEMTERPFGLHGGEAASFGRSALVIVGKRALRHGIRTQGGCHEFLCFAGQGSQILH